jgi:hypothetical protein
VKELTSNYTVSCLPLTTPPLNTTTTARNRTKMITPKWRSSRIDSLGSGSGLYKQHRKIYHSASILTSIYTIKCLLFSFLFLYV